MKPRQNKHHSRYVFLKLSPEHDETTQEFAARLRKASHGCEYGDNQDDRILERLIQHCTNESLVRKCVSNRWNLTEFLKQAGEADDIRLQMKQMKLGSASANKVMKTDVKSKQGQVCGYCGLSSHVPGRNCPAYGKTCRACRGRNHFSSVCQNKKKSEDAASEVGMKYKKRKKKKSKGARGRKVETQDDSISSDDEFFMRKIIAG